MRMRQRNARNSSAQKLTPKPAASHPRLAEAMMWPTWWRLLLRRNSAKVHSADYERELDEACRMGMQLFHSLDNPISSQSFAAARAAVGTALTAAAGVLRGNRAFVIARPPGHHAERVEAMGFCFFNT